MLSSNEKNLRRRIRKWAPVAKEWQQTEIESDGTNFMSGISTNDGGIRPNSIEMNTIHNLLKDVKVSVWNRDNRGVIRYFLSIDFYMRSPKSFGFVNVTRKIRAMLNCGVIQVVETDVVSNDIKRGYMQFKSTLQ
jgi:hypothetical protein